VDLRGYNKSDQPKGVENYAMDKLVEDVAAVINHFQKDKAVIVGHDWGGAIAWSFAMAHPEKTDRLIILNLPHLRGMIRELANFSKARCGEQAGSGAFGLLGQGAGGTEKVPGGLETIVYGRNA
jgi:pimeloyl-ACP methyl ester carboxylesterase